MRQTRIAQQAHMAEKEPGLDLSSLVDVSFLLLIYFLVTSTLNIPDADLRLTLGDGGHGIVIDIPVVKVDANGQVFFADEMVDADVQNRNLPNLQDRLEIYSTAWRIAPNGVSPSVIISANDASQGQRFVDVMNCLAEVGISNIALVGMDE